jgi:GATA-binding protein, other eukaryote
MNRTSQQGTFPSGPFNFNVPGFDNVLFDLGSGSHTPDFLPFVEKPRASDNTRDQEYPITYMHSPESLSSVSDQLSMSTLLSQRGNSDGIATFEGHPVPTEEEMQQLLGLGYPVYDRGGNEGHLQNQYTHVDPTQILSAYPNGAEGIFAQTYHHSPSSDEWATTTGFNSSATASPEVGSDLSGIKPRKVVTLKRSPQAPDVPNRPPSHGTDSGSSVARGSTENGNEPSEDPADLISTVCSNCTTTNTPLWRRDADGQPLCE